MGAQDVQADTLGLKHLQFVRSYASYFSEVASSVYKGTKARLPEQLGPTIKNFEDRASAFKPYVETAQGKSDSLLKGVDGQVKDKGFDGRQSCLLQPWISGGGSKSPKCWQLSNQLLLSLLQVDYVLKNGSSVVGDQKGFLNQKLQAQRKFHENNLKHFNSSRSAITDKIASGVNWLKSHGLNGTIGAIADNGKAAFDKYSKVLSSTWEDISKTPIGESGSLVLPQSSAAFSWFVGKGSDKGNFLLQCPKPATSIITFMMLCW